jgi:hypothetical protein
MLVIMPATMTLLAAGRLAGPSNDVAANGMVAAVPQTVAAASAAKTLSWFKTIGSKIWPNAVRVETYLARIDLFAKQK